MPNIARRRTCVLIAMVCLVVTGCATQKYYAFPENDASAAVVFPGHEIESLIETSIYEESAKHYRILFCQRQTAPADTANNATTSFVRMEDLCLVFDGKGEPVCPPPEDVNETWRELKSDGTLHGPMYSWGWVQIPDSCERLEVRYTAILVDGVTHQELERREARHSLRQGKHKIYFK